MDGTITVETNIRFGQKNAVELTFFDESGKRVGRLYRHDANETMDTIAQMEVVYGKPVRFDFPT